jgi:hypothetical protein
MLTICTTEHIQKRFFQPLWNGLVYRLLVDRLGDHADLVGRYLGREKAQRNTMPVPHTAAASLR